MWLSIYQHGMVAVFMWLDPFTVDHVRVPRMKAAMAFLTYICSYIGWSHYQKEVFGRFPYPIQQELPLIGLITFYGITIVIALLTQQVGLSTMKPMDVEKKEVKKRTKKGKTTLKKKPTKVE
eukprot:TRINITY_DN5018_c0_g1_i2.p1 TRINITY_DN5018_c0_g1~~TRINITY_DN5018_c0_g1_i2.p1  ORF type:complete len:122 (-),score=31.62 TRINITY_DN5018_c0_g1_i2:50-415(-)